MDNVEKGDMRQDLPRTAAGLAPEAPPPTYSSYDTNPQAAPPPIYGSFGNEAQSQTTVSGIYHSTDGVPGVDRRHLPNYKLKSLVETYMLAVSPFGLFGAHHFYLQRYCWGIVYFFTCGLLGCGYLIDWFRVPCLVNQSNEKIKNPGRKDQKTVSDAYTMWFPMGLLGFHHYYLENYAWGVVYTCTLGLGGIGWIVDAFRMPYLVRSFNESQNLKDVKEKNACLTVALTISPLGALGAHHYYLNRPVWGFLYTFTLGLVGIGWVFDWFRLPVLIKRANRAIRGDSPSNVKTIDDTYILWFTFGLLGFHHFYLGRPLWGVLYFFTVGVVGIGWLVDVCRIPFLVKEANLKLQAEQEQRGLVASSAGQTLFSTAGILSTQGYTNYSMANPTAPAPINPTWHYPSQGYNYQQGGDAWQHTSEKPPLENCPPTTSPYYQTASNEGIRGPQFPASVNDLAPPPYQPYEPGHANYYGNDVPNNNRAHKD